MSGREEIEINDEFKKALELLEDPSRHVFITGKAGTGKSTLLELFRDNTGKKTVVLAPTGVAAVNVKGETIHSFFKFKPNITPDKVKKLRSRKRQEMYRAIDMVIIDEISMVRADLLDCVDKFLRLNGKDRGLPFGWVKMAFFGDMYQLPPVVMGRESAVFRTKYKSAFFFDAGVFGEIDVDFIELRKIYRQKDERFIELLNGIRTGTITDGQLEEINSRVDVRADINAMDRCVYLAPTNAVSAAINHRQLKRIKKKEFRHAGLIQGEFDRRALPTETDLAYKIGAQVMLLNNDEYGRWVNGTIGKIVKIKKAEPDDIIYIELPDGTVEGIGPFIWELFEYRLDPRSKELVSEVAGKFVQYPFKLAWAITIHKSQGKTFDRAIVDTADGAFACGQIYVALSRCRTLEGIILKKPIRKEDILTDRKAVDFLTRREYSESERKLPAEEKIRVIQKAIDDGKVLDIIYLKPNAERSERMIKPIRVGDMEFAGRNFVGVEAYLKNRDEPCVFRVDRILSIGPGIEVAGRTEGRRETVDNPDI